MKGLSVVRGSQKGSRPKSKHDFTIFIFTDNAEVYTAINLNTTKETGVEET